MISNAVFVLLLTLLPSLEALHGCGTKDPTPLQLAADQARIHRLHSKHRRNLQFFGSCEDLVENCDQCINIPVHFHYLTHSFLVAPNAPPLLPHRT